MVRRRMNREVVSPQLSACGFLCIARVFYGESAAMMRHAFRCLIAAFVCATFVATGSAADHWRAQPKNDAAAKFFARRDIPEIRIEIAEPELQKLRGDNRKYVKAKLTENGREVYPDIGIKLKGAAGSFRGVDDRPALTINADKFAGKSGDKKDFHGLDKFHLNNSVQDGTYLNELVCSELFLAAGVPAARVTHARLWLNNRDLGLYVLKEGFDDKFLKRHFVAPGGNIYDGGFLQEIDANLEKDGGDGPDDRSDLKELVQALRHPKPEEKWKLIEQRLNVDQFLTFMALEIMTCHWDGYVRNRNNYRVYFDPASKQAFFFPHGMDQMFGDTNASLQDRGGSLVSQTVMQNGEWYTAYRLKQRELQALFEPDRTHRIVNEAEYRLRAELQKIHPDRAREMSDRAREMRERLTARYNSIRDQIRAEPFPVTFNPQGEAVITDWVEKIDSGGAKLQRQIVAGQPTVLSIEAPQGQTIVASWRAGLLLPQGKYKLVVRAKGLDIQPTESPSGKGAGIRLGGGMRMNQLIGTTDWTVLEHPFDVDTLKKVDAVIELRATKGQVLFDESSLKVVKVKTP